MKNSFIYLKKSNVIALIFSFLSLSINAQPYTSCYSNPQVQKIKKMTLDRAKNITLTEQFKKKFPPTTPKSTPPTSRFPLYSFTTIALTTMVSTATCIAQGVRSSNPASALYSLIPAFFGLFSLTLISTESKKDSQRQEQLQDKRLKEHQELKNMVISLEKIRQALLIKNDQKKSHINTVYRKNVRVAASDLIVTSEIYYEKRPVPCLKKLPKSDHIKLFNLLKKAPDDKKLVDTLSALSKKLLSEEPLKTPKKIGYRLPSICQANGFELE